jgi:DNA-binding transcriptional LysR family regulator
VELAELEIFRAVAREQSITRAARVLDRVQSNVTTRVKQLEESPASRCSSVTARR